MTDLHSPSVRPLSSENHTETRPDTARPADPFFDALRKVASRTLDILQDASADDPELRQALATLVSRAVARGPEAGTPADTAARPRPYLPSPIRGPQTARDQLPLNVAGTQMKVNVVDSPGELARARSSAESAPSERSSERPFERPAERSFDRPFDPDRATLPAELVAERCRLKAKAARWQYERDSFDREDLQRRDREIIESAGQVEDCFLWMCNVNFCRTRSQQAMDLLADCYEALAEAAELVAAQTGTDSVDPEAGEKASEDGVALLAEAQSMLCVMLDRTRAGGGFDPDQRSAFIFAREQARRRGVFVDHLSYGRPAHPEDVAELRKDVAAFLDDARGGRRGKAASKGPREPRDPASELLGKIGWHVRNLEKLDVAWGSFADDDAPARHDLTRIAAAVENLVDLGVDAADARLAEVLRPVVARIPGDAPALLLRAAGDDGDDAAGDDE